MSDMEEHKLKLLRNTRKSFKDVYFSKTERGAGWADQPINMALPVGLCGTSSGTAAYATGRWEARPTAVKPLTAAGEKYWIEKLVVEANRELKSGLSLDICYNRTLSAVKRQANNVVMMSMQLGQNGGSSEEEGHRRHGDGEEWLDGVRELY
jgi:hypothetical protein